MFAQSSLRCASSLLPHSTPAALLRRQLLLLRSRAHISSSYSYSYSNPRLASTMAAAATLHPSAFLSAIRSHDPASTAVVHSLSGRTFTYGGLLHDIAAAKARVLAATGRREGDLAGERIAFLVENSYDYVGARNCYLSSV